MHSPYQGAIDSEDSDSDEKFVDIKVNHKANSSF